MPKLQEITVNYSVGVKANLGNYESGDAHVSRTEKWDVSDLTIKKADEFYVERYMALRDELGPMIEHEYAELKGTK